MTRLALHAAVSLVTLSIAIGSVPAFAQDTAATGATAAADDGAEAIVVIGSRRQDRTVADSAVPIDVISADALTENGFTETNRLLGQLVPSFNFPQPSLTDGTDSVRPATLRGLAPDQTLVLVNGRRRHNSALLNLNGSVGRGSAAVDLNTIPPLAIEQIEVLRDGAASQYGSDAIAGVINVRLRRAAGGRATITFGQYRTTMDNVPDVTGVALGANGQPLINTQAGTQGAANTTYLLTDSGGERRRNDGETLTIATNIGLPVGDSAYVNLTAQFQDRNATNRAAADPRVQYPLVGGLVDPRELTFNRFNHRYGDADTQDMTFFVNAGADLSAGAELYGWASYNIRDGESAGFYRRANDARNRNFAASTTSFVPFYPDGFLPLIVSTVEDMSLAGGVRGDIGGWNYDASVVYGSNRFDFGVTNSFNTSIGGTGTQQRFDAGGLRFGQTSVNVDVQREYPFLADTLSVAFGLEYRNENFRIVAGDPQSYLAGPFSASPFNAPAGSQVFPGFRPANEVDASRDSYAAYAELETEIVSGFTVQAAGRYEHFSDFGDTVNGKLAARFEPIEGLGIRGSISTGFRAPSLHQQYYATTSTNNVNGTLVEIGTFPVSSPVAIALGAQPLEPEESLNYSGGITFDMIPGLSITADYYHIDINNRIIITENLQDAGTVPPCGGVSLGPVKTLLCNAGFNNINSARFFINGIDTTTEGYDVVASYRLPDVGVGTIRLTAGYNHNRTTITSRALLPTLPGLTLFGRQESLRLTDGQPRDKINAGIDWDAGIVAATFRGNRYGEVLSPGVDAARDQTFGSEWVFDLELRIRPTDAIEVALGANNLFDQYPDRPNAGIVNGQNYGLNNYFLAYSSFSPFGFNGRYVYGRVSLNF
jgi:iron complex outermembrane recepter protein